MATDITAKTVIPGQSFNVVATWNGGDAGSNTAVKWPAGVLNNALFTSGFIYPATTSGSQSFTLTAPATEGSYKVRVYVSTGGKFETAFADVAVTVKAAPTPVLTTITVTPPTATVVKGNTQAFTAAPKDQNSNPIAATITWASSNTSVGTISATGVLTAVSAGTTTVTASSGSVSGTTSVTVPAPTPVLTTITVTPSTASVLITATQAFTASSKDQFGNPIVATITWTSSNTTVGTINTVGTFTALAAGTTTITATSGSVSGSAAVTVPALISLPVLTTISVTPSNANVLVGKTQAFAATPKDQNGNPMGATITWASSNTAVGTIDTSGTFTALAAGTTTITAASKTLSGTVSETATVTVTGTIIVPVLTTITVTPSTASVLVGGTQAFAAAPKDQNGNAIVATITWTSSNSTVGTINAAGTFTALAAGTTTVKAANGTVNGTATITVTAPVVTPVLKTITVTPATASVLVGATQAFVATPKDQNGKAIAATITWTSSNSTVGTIAAGTFTALAAGTTTVRATSGAVSGTAAVTVTATPPSTRKFSVTFIVTDSLTGNPIRDVKVSLKGKDIKTNNAGKAIFTNVASGTYEYKIEKDGYREIEGKITVARETTIALKLVKKSPQNILHKVSRLRINKPV